MTQWSMPLIAIPGPFGRRRYHAPFASCARMDVMRRRVHVVLILLAALSVAAGLAAQDASQLPGVPASPQTVAEIQQAMDAAVARFDAMDEAGVLGHVSEQYRTGPLT